MGRPLVRDRSTAIVVGLGLTAAGMLLLYDAWEGRGGRKPRILGPFLPW
jgi:hypothetical protein